MAKLEKDFREYTGPHVFYAHIPYRSSTAVSGKKDFSGNKTNLSMGLSHDMFT